MADSKTCETGQGSCMPPGYIAPDTTPKCTWSPTKDHAESPHHFMTLGAPPQVGRTILPNILQMIGNTPLVRLDKIARSEGLKCELLGKCEFFNAGGSVKDRIGLRMIEEAEREGTLKPGDTIIEPTSGNTGIGLALVAAVKGYRCVIVMPEKMSNEKVSVLKALGAEIIRTPTSASYDSPESHISVSWKLKNEIPNSHILDQHRNPGNPIAHYDTTAEEIIQQTGGKLDMVVVGAGTGGTVAGIGRKLREKLPHVKIIGVDAVGSIIAQPQELNEGAPFSYQVEGIGDDFIPAVLDRSVVDKWYKCTDKDSFFFARRLIREEGLLCGGSSGSAVATAIEAARELKEGQRCVVILPDSIRNYLTKFVDDGWMIQKGYLEPEVPAEQSSWWWNQPISALSLPEPITFEDNVTCGVAAKLLREKQISQVPILTSTGEILGVVTLSSLTYKIVHGLAKLTDPITKVSCRTFQRVQPDTSLGQLSQILEKEHFAIVTRSTDSSNYASAKHDQTTTTVSGIVTNTDLLQFISQQTPE